ncbi:MAG: hypothetical protein K0Q73_1176 [Paenibacillus sp.]|nr:hypothetical protein [Paenibacillus sp.]
MVPNGTLIKGSSPAVYLLEEGRIRPFIDGHSFYHYKFKWEQVVFVNDDVLLHYPTGNFISRDAPFRINSPGTLLVNGSSTKGVFLLRDDVLYPFATQAVFENLKFGFDEVVCIPEAIIHFLPKGYMIKERVLEDYGVMNNRLYRAPSGDLYYAEDSKLRLVGGTELQFFHWKPERAVTLTQTVWNHTAKGTPIRLKANVRP